MLQRESYFLPTPSKQCTQNTLSRDISAVSAQMLAAQNNEQYSGPVINVFISRAIRIRCRTAAPLRSAPVLGRRATSTADNGLRSDVAEAEEFALIE